MPAPIIVTVYTRIAHFQRCIAALSANALAKESELVVVSDAASRTVDEEAVANVRSYARQISGFAKVTLIFRDRNLGMFASALDAIDSVLQRYDRFIFLEDDIVVANDFLDYMNRGLAFYENHQDTVFSICAFRIPFTFPRGWRDEMYFFPAHCPWGFATWRDRFLAVDFGMRNRYQEVIDSPGYLSKAMSMGSHLLPILEADSKGTYDAMDVRIVFHQIERDMVSVFPRVSRSINIGCDGSGVHCGEMTDKPFESELAEGAAGVRFEPIVRVDERVVEAYRRYLDVGLIQRGWRLARSAGPRVALERILRKLHQLSVRQLAVASRRVRRQGHTP